MSNYPYNDPITFEQGTLLSAVIGGFILGLILVLGSCDETERRHELLRDCVKGQDDYAKKVNVEVCKKIIELELGTK